MNPDPRAEDVRARLTKAQAEALPLIWPATENVALNWPRWVKRSTIDELAAIGLVGERDLTPLGKAVRALQSTEQPE